MTNTTPHPADPTPHHEANSRERALEAALNAMLTQFGMDEDEWAKPTFDQARRALATAPQDPSPSTSTEDVRVGYARDAARYRWLRDRPDRPEGTNRNAAGSQCWIDFSAPLPEGMDATIDAALAAQPSKATPGGNAA